MRKKSPGDRSNRELHSPTGPITVSITESRGTGHGASHRIADGARGPEIVAMAAFSEDIELYRTRVELLRLSESDEVILNSSHDHAAVLIENLIKSGRERIYALCRYLNRDVWGNERVLAAIQEFFDRGGKHLEILVQERDALEVDETKGAHPLVERFAGRSGVIIKPAPNHSAAFNFLVVDGRAFRFEPDAKSEQPLARASFNRPELGAQLDEFFQLVRDAA